MNMKRMRGRNHRQSGGGGGQGGGVRHHAGGGIPLNRNHVFDSNGPDVRVRGTAQQLFEKYLQLGRDATSSGDRVTAEAFFQHAEHYFRILNAMNQAAQQNQQNGQGQQRRHQPNGEAGQGNEDGQSQGGMSGGMAGSMPEQDEPNLRSELRSEMRPAGLGDQPEARDIPIAVTQQEA